MQIELSCRVIMGICIACCLTNTSLVSCSGVARRRKKNGLEVNQIMTPKIMRVTSNPGLRPNAASCSKVRLHKMLLEKGVAETFDCR